MAHTDSHTMTTTAAAIGAVGLAVYAWVGPLPFVGEPGEWSPLPPQDDSQSTPPRLVGPERPNNFTQLASSLASLRGPEREQAVDAAPTPAIDTPQDTAPPPPPLDGWSFSGLIGPADNLTAVVTLPDGTQQAVKAGDTFPGGQRVVRVTEAQVFLIDENDEERSLTLASLIGTDREPKPEPSAGPPTDARPGVATPIRATPQRPANRATLAPVNRSPRGLSRPAVQPSEQDNDEPQSNHDPNPDA